MRVGVEVTRLAHNQENIGANPILATIPNLMGEEIPPTTIGLREGSEELDVYASVRQSKP